MCADYSMNGRASSPNRSMVSLPSFEADLSGIDPVSSETRSVPVLFQIPRGPSKFDDLKLKKKQYRVDFENTIDKEWREKYGEDDFDQNKMNLFHYCIWNNHYSTVMKLAECGYDVNSKMCNQQKTASMELILYRHKCHMDEGNKMFKGSLFRVAKFLTEKGAEINEQFMLNFVKITVNIPPILEYLLQRLPSELLIEDLLKEIRCHFKEKFANMGFYDLMLEYSPSVISYMINNSGFHKFLNDYKDSSGQTVVHSAAKCFKPSMVKPLINICNGSESIPDKNGFTPITALLNQIDILDTLGDDSIDEEKAAKVIVIILEHKGISVIQEEYNGVPAIVDDMQRGRNIIVQAISKYPQHVNDLLSQNNGSVFHILAKHGCSLTVFENILHNNDDLLALFNQPNKQGKTPFDYAVEHRQTSLIKEVCNSKVWKKKDWLHEITTACKIGNLEALRVFDNHYHETIKKNYKELLHTACEHDRADIVLYLCKQRIREKDFKLQVPSALMLAADSNATGCINRILDDCDEFDNSDDVDGGSGALSRFNQRRVSSDPRKEEFSVATKDDDGDNVLCRAIRNGKRKAVMALLTHEKDKTASEILREQNDPPPLKLLIQYMPDVAEWVLNDQITSNGATISYNYETINDLKYSPGYHSLKQFCTSYFHCCKPLVNTSEESGHDQSSVLLNNSGESGHNESSKGSKVLVKTKPTDHMLYIMAQSKSLQILRHKLVEDVIKYYWRYASVYWIVLRMFYFLSTVMLTTFTLNLPHPKGDICIGNMTSGGRRTFLFFSSSTVVLFLLISLLINALNFVSKERWKFFFKFRKYRVIFETIVAICVLSFITGYYGDTRDWCAKDYQWNFGAICTCLSWVTVLISLKGIPSIARHINKLFIIIKQFVEVSLLPIILLVAFFLPFLMLFTAPWPEQAFGPLHDVDSCANTLNILLLGVSGSYVGPQDVEDFKDFPVASYLIFVGFLIIVTVLFNNLLISLAVGDSTDLQTKADLEQYRLKVELIIDMLYSPLVIIPSMPNEKKITKSTGLKEWSEAKIILEKALKDKERFSDLVLKGTDEEIIRKKIEKLQKEVKETNKTNAAFQRQMKVKMNLLASALGTGPQQDENN